MLHRHALLGAAQQGSQPVHCVPPAPSPSPEGGTQYRSAIYHHTPQQLEVALAAVARAQNDWPSPIVTEVKGFETFYEAENVHQAYYEMNKEAPYCRAVIAPKMKKFKKDFGTKFD